MQQPTISGYQKTDGIVMFARMLEKIRLHAARELPEDYNLGHGLDGRVCRFLRMEYEDAKSRTLQGNPDVEVLEWCYRKGRQPSDEEKLIFNHFMKKRGWRDDISEWVVKQKEIMGVPDREDIQTAFDVHDYDEGRI